LGFGAQRYKGGLGEIDSMACIQGAGMGQVLVLNASYEPLNITTWRRAMVMMLKGKAESLEQDSTREIRRGTHLPTVIRLRQYVRVPFRQLPLTRRNLFHRDNHSCQYCGCRNEPLSIDHVVPRSRGGGDTWENVTTACLSCNVRKGNRTPKEADMPLMRVPRRPLSSLSFEATRQIHSGRHSEWAKYVIGA
jgi:5-methylcytosine-specific restriction endonuclease McrA